MELRAAVEALRLVPSNARVRIVTDSQYLVQGATSWVKGWKRNGWQTRDERPVEHRDLWEELDQLAGTRVAWEQVRGHTGHPENERADQLAQSYADRKSPTARITTNIPPQPNPKPATAANTSTSCYLSLVHGRLVRDTTWEACKARVHGVSGARFKKCRTYAEQVATVLAWNLSPTVLDMLEATRED
jgi:ribonuclease HI